MHAARAPILLVLAFLLAPSVLAAAPDAMLFNGAASADVRGAVNALSMDGGGKWGAVAVADAPVNPLALEDRELFVYNLKTQNRAWDAKDNDAVNEGARLVAVANGTSPDQGGDWVLLVNNTVPSILTVYRSTGIGRGGQQSELLYQYEPRSGPINALGLSADGSVFALATGDAANNKSIILLRNKGDVQAPVQLFRFELQASQTNVTAFTSVAVNQNATVPDIASASRSIYTVVGAQTVSTSNVVEGYVSVFETNFGTGDPDNPKTTKIFHRDTTTPVTRVAITHDGEYAVAGTQDGQVYLISIGSALQRRGATGIDAQLLSTQQSVGARVTSLDIANLGGQLFAAGTESGDVVVYRNQFDASGALGAHARELGKVNANTPFCSPQLRGAINSLHLTGNGDQLVAGAANGLFALEVGPYLRYALPSLEPAWCIAIPDDGAQGRTGVHTDVSADGKTIFAASGSHVYGYKNTDRISLAAADGVTRKGAPPGTRVQFPITVRNEGSEFDRINFTVRGPSDAGWEFAVSNGTPLLMPGKSMTVLVNVTSPPTLQPGNFTITVEATGDRGGLAGRQTLALRLDLGQLRRVEVRPEPGTLIASAGAENRFPIKIHNGGNAEDRFRLSAVIPEPQENFKSPGSEWGPRMDPVVITVPPNSDATATLVVVPQGQRGDSATIQVTAEPDILGPDEAPFSDTKQVLVAVEPSYNGDISLVETKEYRVEAGQTVHINFTVKNLGNTRDIFLLRNHTEPANAPGWRLQFSDERFELRRTNEQKVVRLSALAQLGLQPGENVKIVVDLFSEGLQKQGSSGQVDSQAVTVSVVPKQNRGLFSPIAPEPLVLLAIAALAFAARRRGA